MSNGERLSGLYRSPDTGYTSGPPDPPNSKTDEKPVVSTTLEDISPSSMRETAISLGGVVVMEINLSSSAGNNSDTGKNNSSNNDSGLFMTRYTDD